MWLEQRGQGAQITAALRAMMRTEALAQWAGEPWQAGERGGPVAGRWTRYPQGLTGASTESLVEQARRHGKFPL